MSKKKTTPQRTKSAQSARSQPTRPTPSKGGKKIQKKAAQPKLQPWMLVTIVLIAVAAVGAIALVVMNQDSPEETALPASVTVQEAYTLYNQGAFVLDVRTQEEWDEYHAPNTTLIPLDELPARLSELDKNRQIVVVCRSGNRSQEGRDILLEAGFNAASMDGGLNAWRDADYPVE